VRRMFGELSALLRHGIAAALICLSPAALAQEVSQESKILEITITDYDLPIANSMPQDVFASKRDGSAWYSAPGGDMLGRYNTKTQKFEEFHLRPGSDPNGFVEHFGSGVQTTVYFTSRTGGFIGEFDLNTKEIREFRIAGAKSQLHDLTFDPNGAVWFTMLAAHAPKFPQGGKIGTMNIFTSEIKLEPVPTKGASPYSILVNSKGTPFFTELNSTKIASVNPVTLKITEYSLPNPKSGVEGLTITPDDSIWITDHSRGYLVRFDPKTRKFEEWQSPGGAKSGPAGIANDGKGIWYAESGTNMIVRFDIATKKFQSWPTKGIEPIEKLFVQQDGSLWFTRPKANRITQITVKEGNR
jgi:virginiamycin B lyase